MLDVVLFVFRGKYNIDKVKMRMPLFTVKNTENYIFLNIKVYFVQGRM